MHLGDLLSVEAVLEELGRRVERHRLERNLTQQQLAEQAGVGRATVQRLERGESVQMTNWVKVLGALELLSGLDAAIPETIELPVAQLERERRNRRRRRATGRRATHTEPAAGKQPGSGAWTWGDQDHDEPGAGPA